MISSRMPVVAVLVIAELTVSCGGGGGSGSTPPSSQPPPVGPPPPPILPDPTGAPGLKTVLAPYFSVGGAIEPSQLSVSADTALLTKHFSSITAENAMKPSTIKPGSEAQAYDFGPADQLIVFARANNIGVRGHTLLWHVTAPDWFFAGDRSNPAAYCSLVEARLRGYIRDVLTHFGDDIYAWDVVNEVAGDAAGQIYRTESKWYQAFNACSDGQRYIEIAFNEAAATRTAGGFSFLLFINDYSTESPGKRANVLAIVQDLVSKGVPIDGVGHQFHIRLGIPAIAIDQALSAVEALNLANHVTELDVSVYADPGSCFSDRTGCLPDYGASPPQSVLAQQAQLYREVFATFRNHDASRSSVTMWGIADHHSWLHSWPVMRTDHPLLFDAQLLPKAGFWAVADPAFVIPQ
jgi:endo-1,4-beta-xylanase